ncbi:hypothetical protein ACFRCI_50740 [Streptomyces sp. NPDC056638]|uniref:hypothetical protein n=1 Tax=Streptomyces sp. NPDC056638 TaxID=3345887 RepID=UPI00368A0E8D
MLDPAAVGDVDLVESHVMLGGGPEQPDRQRDHPELDHAGPDGPHDSSVVR